MPPVGSRVRSPGRGSGGLELCRQWDQGQIAWSRVRWSGAMPSVGSRVRSPGRGSGFGAMPPVGSRVRSPDRGSGGLELYRQWDLGSDRLVRGLGVPGLCAERDPGSDHLVRGSEGPGTMLPAGSRVRSSGQRVRGVSGYAPSGIQG